MLVRAGVVTVVLSSVCAFAQFSPNPHNNARSAQEVHLYVNVHTATGEPAANAHVELRAQDLGLASMSAYTNGNGVAELTGVPGGMYNVVVSYKLSQAQDRENLGFGEHTLSFTLPADTTGANVGNANSVSVADYKVPDKARKEYRKAEDSFGKGNQDEVLSHLNKALEIYPQYADALTLRAIVRMDRKESDGALADLASAIQADPSCSLAYFAMGSVYNSMNKFVDAEAALQRGLTLNPKSWQGYFELGKAFVGKGDYQAGIEQLQKAEEFSAGKYPPIHLVKAHAMLAVKHYPGAMKELQAFITEAPNDSRSASAKETLDKVNAYVAQGTIAQK